VTLAGRGDALIQDSPRIPAARTLRDVSASIETRLSEKNSAMVNCVRNYLMGLISLAAVLRFEPSAA